jgi:hypothetical protein
MATTGRPRGRPPKAKTNTKNYNPKSRANLRQYSQGKQSAEQAKMIKAITTEIEIEIPPEMLEVIIPTKKVFSNDETKRFLQLLKLHLKELSNDDKITFADIQNVAELCKNIIMEDRLLADAQTKAKANPTAIVDVMATIDKLKKRNQSLSDSLATNRNVRIDPKAGGNITILDLLEAYEVGETASIAEKLAIMEKEEAEEAGPDKYQTTVDGMIR